MNKRFLIALAGMVLAASLLGGCTPKDSGSNLSDEQKALIQKGLDAQKADLQAQKDKNEKLKKELEDAKNKPATTTSTAKTTTTDTKPTTTTTPDPEDNISKTVPPRKTETTVPVVGGKLVIPDGTTTIAEGAYANKGITSLTLPNGLKTIGNGAFADNSLTSVTIPSSVTRVGNGAFVRNPITKFTLMGNTLIEEFAFDHWSGKNATVVSGKGEWKYAPHRGQWGTAGDGGDAAPAILDVPSGPDTSTSTDDAPKKYVHPPRSE